MRYLKMFILCSSLVYFCLPTGLSSNDANIQLILNEANSKMENKSYQEAHDLFNKAENMDPNQIAARYGVAESYYKLEKYKNCDETCDKTLRDESVNEEEGLDRFAELSAKCTIAYKKSTGKDLVNLDQANGTPDAYQQARGYYYLAISMNPNSTSAWNGMGILEMELGNYTGSVACFDEALKINSSLAVVWSNKGASLAKLGRYDESLKCLDNATNLDPNLAEAWYNKAKTLSGLKDEAFAQGKLLNSDLAEKMQYNWLWNEDL